MSRNTLVKMVAAAALLLPVGLASVTTMDASALTMNALRAYKAVARMRGDTLADGRAVYTDRPKAGTVEQRLAIEIEDAAPGETYAVTYEGVELGFITTDEFGVGELNLRTARFIDDPEEWQAIPANFPRILEGDQISVGPVSGTFRER